MKFTRGTDGTYRAESDADGGIMIAVRKHRTTWDLYVCRREMIGSLSTFGREMYRTTEIATLRLAKAVAVEFESAPRGLCPMADAIGRAYDAERDAA